MLSSLSSSSCALLSHGQHMDHPEPLLHPQRHRVEYEQQLIMVMNQFNVLDEFQLITGCIVLWDKMHRRRNGKRFDTKTHIVEAVQALRRKYLRQATSSAH